MKYTVELQEDPDTKDLILPLPQPLLDELGWGEGTKVKWVIDQDNNTVSLVKLE